MEQRMNGIPISTDIITACISDSGIEKIGSASIREIVACVNRIEEKTGIPFLRMEMGVPGLNAPDIAVQAEIEALRDGVASIYAPIEGIPELKHEASRFIRLFLDVDVPPEACIPTGGSLQGSYVSFMTINRSDPEKERTLFIDPCFPVHKQQCHLAGQDFQSFDIYDFRGDKLREKLEGILRSGKVASILYSNPNNPSWVCLNEEELLIIGELATAYDVIVLEDLAYFGMDFRQDYAKPGMKPFQPTVAKYTDNYVLLISTSKVFSYAGQRLGIMAISDKLFRRRYPHLKKHYASDRLGHAMVYGTLYPISAGTAHSPQYAATALFKAVNEQGYPFLQDVKEYGFRAKKMKELFIRYGFRIVYDMDLNVPIADGFYFTISYPGFATGSRLLEEMLHYGISAITLDISGSERTEGIRACVSQVSQEMLTVLEERLSLFQRDHT